MHAPTELKTKVARRRVTKPGGKASRRGAGGAIANLLEQFPYAYAEIQLVRDIAGELVDLRYLDVNAAFEEILGTARTDVMKRRGIAPLPDLTRCVIAGVRKGTHALDLRAGGRALRVRCYPNADDAERMFVVIDEVTRYEAAEKALRDEETRQAFLNKLGDAIRLVADPIKIQEVAARILGEHLGADRCYYIEFDSISRVALVERDFAPDSRLSVVGQHRFEDFEPIVDVLLADRPFIAADVETRADIPADQLPAYRALSIRANITIPLRKDGRLVAGMAVLKAVPYDWSEEDVRLVHETAERTWAAIERAQAEKAVRIGDERFRTMADAAPVLLWETDSAGIVFVNGHHLDYFGVPFDQVRGMGWADFLHPDDAKAYRDLYLDAFSRRVPYSAEARFRRADGTYRWLRNTGRPLGESRFVGCSIDISDLLEAQLTLAESEARYRALADASNQVLYRQSPDWSQMRQLIGGGFLADTIEPDSDWFNTYIHPDDQPLVRATILRAIETKSVFELEHRVLRVDGSLGWTLSRSVPVLDKRGEIVDWFGAAADVTARREAQDELRESKERLATLVAEMQHRTRNLMGVVRAMADKTLRASSDLEDFEGKFRDRLGALARVQSLLSRIGDHERISFDELLRVELMAHGVLGADDPRVELDGPDRVGLRSRTVQTLALALHELATNAIKYGALGSPGGRLTIRWFRSRTDDGQAMLNVDWRERGVSMPASDDVRPGQGTELIERALPYQLQATTHYAFGSDGIHCTMVFPVPDGKMAEA